MTIDDKKETGDKPAEFPMQLCELMAEFDRRRTTETLTPITTGFVAIDKIVGGRYPGELCVIASHSGVGKTSFVLSSIRNMVRRDIPVALFVADYTYHKGFVDRIVSSIIYYDEQETPLKPEETPLYIDLQSHMTIEHIGHEARKLVQEKGVKCIFIESLYNIFYAEGTNRDLLAKGEVCDKLKQLAIELKVPIVATCHMKFFGDDYYLDRKFRPTLTDLPYGGVIERFADTVYLLNRPDLYGITEDAHGESLVNILEVHIDKNKYGHGGKERLFLYPSTGLVAEKRPIKKKPISKIPEFFKNDVKHDDDIIN